MASNTANKSNHIKSNFSIMEFAWNNDDINTPTQAAPVQATQPTQTASKGFQIKITGPDGDKKDDKQPPKQQNTEPPELQDSEALSTLLMFSEMGLAGDDADIFDDINVNNNHVINNNNIQHAHGNIDNNLNGDILSGSVMHDQIFKMEQKLKHNIMAPLAEEPATPASAAAAAAAPATNVGNGLFNPSSMNNGGNNQINGLNNDIFSNVNMGVAGAGGNSNQPIALKGGKKTKKVQITDNNSNVDNDDQWMIHYKTLQQQKNRIPRTQNKLSDMESYKEITPTDLKQFKTVITDTERLINDMLDLCNYNGYGLNDIPAAAKDDNKDQKDNSASYSKYIEMKYRSDALNESIMIYNKYLDVQLNQYNFNLSSNAIVDLIGKKHIMEFKMNYDDFYKDIPRLYNPNYCFIDPNGFILYKTKRLTPYYYFNVLTQHERDKIDITINKFIRDYLRDAYFLMQSYIYPSKAILKGITPKLMEQFENQLKLLYLQPSIVPSPGGINRMRRGNRKSISIPSDKYCVVIFPNHKKHLKYGLWSRSVTYFDNAIRGTMFSYIEDCKQNGYGVCLLNPNENTIQSTGFFTKLQYDQPPFNHTGKDTETLTLPRNESSSAHVNTLYNNFIKPEIIDKWKCKLLLLSHCNGGDDIIYLLEKHKNDDLHKHIIGIAMLDFYNWSLSEFSKETKQIIEQRAAMYMSLHGSNESAYGFEPSADKSPVTIFRTANKEKRYAPCYNKESVFRFFKSKIELNKQQNTK